MKTLDILYQLNVVNAKNENFIARDQNITRFLVDVNFAIVLLKSSRYDYSNEMLSLISIIEVSNDDNEIFIKFFNFEKKSEI